MVGHLVDEMVVFGLELDCVLLPEALIVDGAPGEMLGSQFLDVLVEGAEHADVALEDGPDVLKGVDQFLVLEVALEDGR